MTQHQQYSILDQTTLDNLMEGYQLIGFDWRYLYVNDTVVKQSLFSTKEDLLGYTMMEKYPGIEKTALFTVLKECMEARTSSTMINEFQFPDNSKGCFELRIEPVPKGLFILSVDITKQMHANQAKKDYLHSLEKMVFMTSHKVRQPVCNILGLINLLDNTKSTKKDVKYIVAYLRDAINVLDKFTKELTTFIQEKQVEMKSEQNQ